jgi:hypothetical protein
MWGTIKAKFPIPSIYFHSLMKTEVIVVAGSCNEQKRELKYFGRIMVYEKQTILPIIMNEEVHWSINIVE